MVNIDFKKNAYHSSLDKAERALSNGKRTTAASYYIDAIEQGEQEILRCTTDAEKDHYQRGIDFCYGQLEVLLPERTRATVNNSPQASNKSKKAAKVSDDFGGYEFLPTETKTTFDDVAGMEDVKTAIKTEIIMPLLHPEEYKSLVGSGEGGGIILYGPPGCGKTYIANTSAGQAQKESEQEVPFFSVDHGELLDKYVGETQKHIRSYFMTLAENEPCIGFIDEFDAIAKKRSKSQGTVNVVNALLAAFGYLEDKNVILIAGTNRPWELDSAMARSGRFGTKIFVPPPDLQSRMETFKIHLKGKPTENIDYALAAELTIAYSNSDIKAICRASGKRALSESVMNNRSEKVITMDDLLYGIANNESSLLSWADEIRQEFIDWRYSDGRLKGKFGEEYSELLRCADWIKRSLEEKVDDKEVVSDDDGA